MSLPLDWMPCLRVVGLLALEVIFVISLATGLLRCSRSAHWQRAVWHTAISGLVLLVLFELSGLARDMASWTFSSRPTSGVVSHANGLSAPAPEPAATLGELTPSFQQQVREQLARRRHRIDQAPSIEPFFGGPSLPWPELIWMMGAIATLVPGLLARLFFSVFHQQRRMSMDGALLSRVAALARQLGIRRPLRVFESERLSSPIAFGVLRPAIGLPTGYTRRFTPVQQEAMLAHELAHLAGHDPAWQALADVAAALLWWHPLVWWARYRLRAAAETAADDASLLVQDGPGVLAECLLQLASTTARAHSPGWVGATGSGFRSGIGQRIERLVELEEQAWTPLSRTRSILLKSVVVITLVAAAIVCTAWAAPVHERTPMKTLKQTWNRSVATVALFAAFNATPAEPSARAAEPPGKVLTPPAQAAELPATNTNINGETLVQDVRLLIGMGKLDEAEAKLRQADRRRFDRQVLSQLADSIRSAREAQASRPAAQPADPTAKESDPAVEAESASESDAASSMNIYRMDPRLLERYGLKLPTAPRAPAGQEKGRVSRGKQQIENKLNQITFNEVLYDGLPLSEVVRDLGDQARRRDPAKQGINFIVTNIPEVPTLPGIDPTNGQPLPAQPVDVDSAIVRVHLRDVRLKDVLDAVVRVANQPIKYSVEDYGVVISPASGQLAGFGGFNPPPGNRSTESALLQVRTFKVDTNTFVAGLQSAFGIEIGKNDDPASRALEIAQLRWNQERAEMPTKEEGGNATEERRKSSEKALAKLQADIDAARAKQSSTPGPSHNAQQALRQLLQQLGINLDVPGKAVFYNELTGVVMVRATSDDLELVQAAIETLGGTQFRPGARPQSDVRVLPSHTQQ